MADDSKQADVGARYAQALFELAKGQGDVAAVEADLKSLKAMRADSADLRTLISSPTFDSEQKGKGLAAIADAAKFGPTTRKFLGLVAANRRASEERTWSRSSRSPSISLVLSASCVRVSKVVSMRR